MIETLVQQIATSPGCAIYPPKGQPQSNLPLPEDLQSFYALCGGAVLYGASMYPLQISSPEDFIPTNMVVVGGLVGNDPSDNWYVAAKAGGEQLVSVDLNPGKLGRCYDSFWDRHAIVGSCAVIALSFTEFLRKAIEAKGSELYWLSRGFASLGDAYD